MPRLARLELDFAPAADAPSPVAAWLLAAGLVAATIAGVQYQSAHAARLRSADELAELNGRQPAGTPRGAVADARAARAAANIARELQVPWADLLGAIEKVPVKDVALLAVEPSAARRTVRITAEAKDAGAMLDYVAALRATAFGEVLLASHHVQQEAPGTPVRFIVQARWDRS